MDGFRSLLVLFVLGLFQRLQAKFVWNTGGASALFVAIALPLDLPRKEVFLSYNFEAEYELPRSWKKKPPYLRNGNGTDDGSISDHLDHQQFDDFVYDDYYDDPGHKHKHKHHHGKKKKKTKPKPGSAGKPQKQKHKRKHKHKPKPKPKPPPEDEEDEDYKDFFQGFPLDGMGDPVARSMEKRSLLSRTKFYNILSHRFEMHGLGTGDRCLLRLICETNSYSLGDLNGVLGSMVHIMFSPSSSRYEALPQRYYTAELDGIKGRCGNYKLECQHSVLDLITQPIARYKENKSKLQ
ncbi:uncharacterized protein [Drosophila bipectinata]|uniref:uncharacterized protein n=1 Tax=Drosophila bipectinata TaxID=42026 RepID=UPI001C8AB798|nr:uncharacterized protein LOC108123369 [Drosophila bipectinata]